jgi:hypothetical protein
MSGADCHVMRTHASGLAPAHVHTSDVATTSTEILQRLKASKTYDRKPYCPVMRVGMMSTSVTLLLSTMLVTSTLDMSRDALMREPGADLVIEHGDQVIGGVREGVRRRDVALERLGHVAGCLNQGAGGEAW